MTTETHAHTHQDGCIICLVRSLTEGVPPIWTHPEPETVSGIVLRTGEQDTVFSKIPFLDLYTPAGTRVRVLGYAMNLANGIRNAEIQVGDTVTIEYLGIQVIQSSGRYAGREGKFYRVDVRRGHH